jgi:hypothetical protein
MEENSIFLKYIFQEDLYIIDESEQKQTVRPEPDDVQLESQVTQKVEEEDQTKAYHHSDESKDTETISYFGQNNQGLLILITDAENELLNQTDLEFLMKVVEGGIKYTKNDFALVNTAKFSIDRIFKEIPYNFLISFGSIQHNQAKYRVIEKDEKKILYADDPASIRNDLEKKKLLWAALKKMFNL